MNDQPGSARSRVLEAATQVVGEIGAGHLTLDRVAQVAGVSKGGLLYHFPSKQALIEAMIKAALEDMTHRISARARSSRQPNARLKATLEVIREQTEEEKFRYRALLAAAAENPDLLAPVRDMLAAEFEQIRAEAGDPEQALIILLAAEGIRFLELFGLLPLPRGELDLMLKRLWKVSRNLP